MEQFKAIFIGRVTPDTGFEEYQKVARNHKLKLDIFTNTSDADKLFPNYSYAFVSRYLAIIEALAAGVPVLAHYNNQIKFDYLTLAPFRPYIKLFSDPNSVNLDFSDINMPMARKWAKSQTWAKVTQLYETLWQM